MAEPIIEFKTQEELEKSLAEWQEKLMLRDWIVKVKLCEKHEMPDTDCLGYCYSTFERQCSNISILKFDDDAWKRETIKPCHEQILVHELLHIKCMGFKSEAESIADCFWGLWQHKHVDEMAKSLIMIKYDLPFEWFRNF